MNQKESFKNTKNAIPKFIYGVGTSLILYFVATTIMLNDDNCSSGIGYDTCIKQLSTMKSELTIIVIVLVGIAVAMFSFMFIGEIILYSRNKTPQENNNRRSAI